MPGRGTRTRDWGEELSQRSTLKDVAAAAGVHTSTASRALNELTRSVVNAETVDRVLEAADRLGYAPHPLARGLRTNRTMTVGIVIPDVENPLFGPFIAGAESALGDDGYSMLIANTEPDHPDPDAVVAALVERQVDGLILATASRNDAFLEKLSARNLPIVLVNRTSESVNLPSVLTDDHAGIGLAVAHLEELGHTAIGHLAGPLYLSTGRYRYDAFRARMDGLGLVSDDSNVVEAEWYRVEPGYLAAKTLLERRPDLTAIVASNDLLALGAYKAIRDMGQEVGTDISVTGYNDLPLVDLMEPGLTSVRVPLRAMGAEAARRLLLNIGHESHESPRVMLTPKLVIRGSTGLVAT